MDAAQAAGAAGAIVPDLPVEEAGAAGRSLPPARLQPDPAGHAHHAAATGRCESPQQATGFIYYVSVTGITGERTALPPEIVDNVGWLREQTPLPICIGFGISRPEHVRMLAPVADGLIVGSAIVRRVAEAAHKPRRGSAGGDRRLRGRVDRGDGGIEFSVFNFQFSVANGVARLVALAAFWCQAWPCSSSNVLRQQFARRRLLQQRGASAEEDGTGEPVAHGRFTAQGIARYRAAPGYRPLGLPRPCGLRLPLSQDRFPLRPPTRQP